MKRIVLIFILVLSLGVMAQEANGPKDFMVLTPKVEQLKPILLAADELATDGDFEIVLYGKNVADILKPETEKFISWAGKLNVKVNVCKMSLDLLQINPNTLPKEINVVDNAFLYAFQRQKAGYKILNQ